MLKALQDLLWQAGRLLAVAVAVGSNPRTCYRNHSWWIVVVERPLIRAVCCILVEKLTIERTHGRRFTEKEMYGVNAL